MDDIKKQIARLPVETTAYENTPCRMRLSMRDIDQILNIKRSRGGGVCPTCRGEKELIFGKDTPRPLVEPCPTCKGTGQTEKVTFTVLEAIRAAEEGKICGGEK